MALMCGSLARQVKQLQGHLIMFPRTNLSHLARHGVHSDAIYYQLGFQSALGSQCN